MICPLCEQAETDRAVKGQPNSDRCTFCLAYDQFGGCREVCAEISTKVAERDWQAACALADAFIERLRGMELPPEASAAAPI